MPSTVVQLFYRARPALDVAALAAEFEAALAPAVGSEARTGGKRDAPGGDVVALERLGSLVLLAVERGATGRFGCCVTVAARPDGAEQPRASALRLREIVRFLADRVAERHPPDARRWLQSGGAPSLELIDRLAATLDLAGRAEDAASPVRHRDGRQLRSEPPDLCPPVPVRQPAVTVANSCDGATAPDAALAARIRAALFAEDPPVPADHPIAVRSRLSLRAMHKLVVCLALSPGAALAAYGPRGGRDVVLEGPSPLPGSHGRSR